LPDKPAARPKSGAVLIGLQLNAGALDALVTLGWLPDSDRANQDVVSDAVVALLKQAGAVELRPAERADQPAPPESSAPMPVRFMLEAHPEMQQDLGALGFLAGGDRGNPDAVKKATLGLIAEGASVFKDLDRLFVSLSEAKRRLEAQEEDSRQSALYALDAVLRYLMLFERTYSEGLLTPLALLFSDLMSLDGGEVRAMVAPVKKRGGTRASGFYNALKGIAAFTATRLEASGLARSDARKAVAKELSKMGMRPARKGSHEGSGEISARTIAKWQQDIAEDIRFEKTAAQEFQACQTGYVPSVLEAYGLDRLPEGSTADDFELDHLGPAKFRRRYLKKLAQFVLETRLGRQKIT